MCCTLVAGTSFLKGGDKLQDIKCAFSQLVSVNNVGIKAICCFTECCAVFLCLAYSEASPTEFSATYSRVSMHWIARL